ncbi:MAG: TetR/AcrR family transcriptional regulator [Oscillospiraceae bacterium]|nr:TetR/AcrR family transcriptional regulator [Oscillospiraceae bacterium]
MSREIENPKELILDESKKIMYAEGYSGISIRRVAKKCGIAVGTIYNYFPTKKELIVEMMASFWEEYFTEIEEILGSREDFYVKLKNIFDSLGHFLIRFKAIWLNSELYNFPDYIESGLKKENIYINKLINLIEELLKKEIYGHTDSDEEKFDTHKMAGYIVINFISMIQMPYLEYQFFENILKKLF